MLIKEVNSWLDIIMSHMIGSTIQKYETVMVKKNSLHKMLIDSEIFFMSVKHTNKT